MGRKCTLTPDVQQRVVDCLAIGAGRATAAAAAGIGESTFYRWMERGEASSSGPFREFWEAVTGAEYQAELAALKNWHGAMPDDWRACKEFLERRFPERWAPPKDRPDARGAHEVIVVRENQLSVEEWNEFVGTQTVTAGPT